MKEKGFIQQEVNKSMLYKLPEFCFQSNRKSFYKLLVTFFFAFCTLLIPLYSAHPRLSEVNNIKGKHVVHKKVHQEKGSQKKLNLDDLFEKARTLAFQGNQKEAREICKTILEKKPDYHEVRVFLARTYAWEQKYSFAREEIQKVIIADSNNLDALIVLIDVEFWSNNLQEALNYCDQGLKIYPDNVDFLLKRAKILIQLENINNALETIRRLLKINSSHNEGLKLLESIQLARRIQSSEKIQSTMQQYHVKLKYRHDNFERGEDPYGPWHMGSFELSGKYKFGTFIGRLNYANRNFGTGGTSGTQYEFDAYPKITKGVYAYLNAGYSSSVVFPKYRYGGELYLNLPLGVEISAGGRYIKFPGQDIPIYTCSLGKYYKNFWFSFRPFVTSKSSGYSFSSILMIRCYSGTVDNYYSLLLGYGSIPLELVFLEDIERFNSYRVGLEIQRLITRNLLIKLIIRYEREEFQLNNFGNRFILDISLQQLIFKKT